MAFMTTGLIVFLTITGIFIVFCIYMLIKTSKANLKRGLTWTGQKPVKNVSKESLSDQLKKVKVLADKREFYLDKYKNDVEYEKLQRAFNELATTYNRWAQEILSTPQLGKKPMNPYVAGGIGYGVGGIVGGVAMGMSAQNNMDKYEKRLAQFNQNNNK